MKKERVAILHQEISKKKLEDELDVLVQAEAISSALNELQYETFQLSFTLEVSKVIKKLKAIKPKFIVNLVESVGGTGELCHFAPAVFHYMGIPFTGSSTAAILLTTNKVATKKILKQNNLPTADWHSLDELEKLDSEKKYILKPIAEDGSLGISNSSLFLGKNKDFILKIKPNVRKRLFIEDFIDGREFNISIIGGSNPEILPHAEIMFVDFEKTNLPKIMSYKAKWDKKAFEYKNTIRNFKFKKEDQEILNKLSNLTLRCWEIFNLNGYARVDFRLDKDNNPFILEVNANPCFAPDSGLAAAATQKNICYQEAVKIIIKNLIY